MNEDSISHLHLSNRDKKLEGRKPYFRDCCCLFKILNALRNRDHVVLVYADIAKF